MTEPRDSKDLHALRAALVQLTAAQAIAAESIATGATHAEAAEAAGVTRETVSRWVGNHPGFRAALDTYRDALVAEQTATVRRIHAKALVAVEKAIDAGDLRAALAALRFVAVPAPPGWPLQPDDALDAEIQRVRISLPPLPPPRDERGNIDTVAALLDTSGPTDHERAERLALERLARAAGVGEA